LFSNLPAAIVPVSSGGKIGFIAQDSIRSPRNKVRNAWCHF